MKIAVLGSGNVGTLISAQLSLKGHDIHLYSRRPNEFKNRTITMEDEDTKTVVSTKLSLISDQLDEVVRNQELLIICVPSFAICQLMQRVFPLIDPSTKILFYPGTGGVEFYCRDFIKAGGIVYGTQRVCSVARLKQYGRSVVTSGKRSEMFIASIPAVYKEEAAQLFSDLFDIKTSALPNYLSVTFTPSNPVLHTSRLYAMFHDYDSTIGYDKIPLFYEDWNLTSSKILMELDHEVQEMCEVIPLDLKHVVSLMIHYESSNAQELTNKIKSIRSFHGLVTPSIIKNGKLHPDLSSRYFTADFPYGLLILKAFAKICNLKTPMMDQIILWYQTLVNKEYLNSNLDLGKDSEEITLPQHYQITSLTDIIQFYNE